MRRLKTVRRPPIYPNGAQAISPVAPSPLFRCPHAVHRCPSVDSGLAWGGAPGSSRAEMLTTGIRRTGVLFVKSGPHFVIGYCS